MVTGKMEKHWDNYFNNGIFSLLSDPVSVLFFHLTLR